MKEPLAPVEHLSSAIAVSVSSPPSSEPPSYGGLAFREIVLCNGFLDTNIKAFSSYESYKMYKDFSKPWISPEQFRRAKYNQNLTRGMPLILSKRTWNFGLGDVRYLKLFDCLTCPEARDRLYQRADNRMVATVYKKRHIRYTRFRIEWCDEREPVVLIYHHLLEILDFELDGKRFRFLKTDLTRVNLNHFAYDLFVLADEQPSLTDEMMNMKVSSKNKLLGSRLAYAFGIRPSAMSEYDLVLVHLWGKLQSCKRDAFFTRTSKTSTFSLFTPVPVDLSLNSSVNNTAFVLTAVTIVLKSFEFDLMVQNAPMYPPLGVNGSHTVYASL